MPSAVGGALDGVAPSVAPSQQDPATTAACEGGPTAASAPASVGGPDFVAVEGNISTASLEDGVAAAMEDEAATAVEEEEVEPAVTAGLAAAETGSMGSPTMVTLAPFPSVEMW